ncbi:protein IQ-DOMAIN 1 isoform X1 [Juglans microcarpa x Juglans regia]|uniref:protein IQ-DOMAIN 1 isoform X1 n=2 Tax=Juglans microcarpa x Juglans regia TaxID=2249226 RepID=UPI001B7F4CB8|nr:protein IQ-DOMAIN 1 isoform X1 [Juglans microcarpa x Juglans regia]
MGVTGELVRSVFSRNRSLGTHESSVRSNVMERKRWSSVRAYLCGDEFNSVLADEDSVSVKSSEATVTQPILEDLTDKVDIQSEETNEDVPEEKQDFKSKLIFREENAATLIQSAFRDFLARRETEGIKLKDDKEELVVGKQSPIRESKVQTGISVEVFPTQEERVALHHRIQQKARTQSLKLKGDWDDSTVSSNISKLRIQNRLEATTRRERALAYAFSQQLRVCSKRKQNKANNTEPNMGWSWLERWMATRLPESSSFEDQIKQLEPIDSNQRFMLGKRIFDVAGEEKESCGSNEVSVQFESFKATVPKERDGLEYTKNRLKATRSVSRRKTMQSIQCAKQSAKVNQRNGSKETENDIKNKQNQPGSKKI